MSDKKRGHRQSTVSSLVLRLFLVDEKPVGRDALGLDIPAARPEFIGKRFHMLDHVRLPVYLPLNLGAGEAGA